MKNPTKLIQTLGLAIGAGSIIVAFQNCSPVNFKEEKSAVFRLQSTDISAPNGGSDISEPSGGSDISEPSGGSDIADGSSDSSPSPSDSPEVPTSDEVSNHPKDDKRSSVTNNSSVATNSLVECELIAPNKKIVLDSSLKIGSNASATRVCMSEFACLRLINDYSAKRNCELTSGSSDLASSEAQCSKIFPGSKGTCKNANILSDEQVESILAAMGQ